MKRKLQLQRRPFCTCGHSYWSHNYPMQILSDPHTFRCERTGCRCPNYTPRKD